VKFRDSADKPQGHYAGARAAKTAICFGMKSPSASGRIPADNAKSSAPRLRAAGGRGRFRQRERTPRRSRPPQ
jgi:hypothetical protein